MKKAVKSRKMSFKIPKKRKKNSLSDSLKAFLFIGVLVAATALITFSVIRIHSSLNNNEEIALQEPAEADQPDIVSDETSTGYQNRDAAGSSAGGILHNDSSSSAAPDVTAAAQPSQNQNTTPPAVNTNTVPPDRKDQNLGALVFVIDDAGNNLRELDPFLRISDPLTIAVLPGLPYSAEAAKRIRAAGKEVILHQPMEAVGAQNPGPGAIYSGMSGQEIREILSRNIEEVGPVTGINNHQGSKITMDREMMKVILDYCGERGIYFLDSRTTAETVVPSVARQIGMKIAERNIFIDNEQNKDSMLRYIESGLTRAQRDGSVIMIGHAWSPDLAPLLAQQFPLYTEQGYTIKTVSDILK